MTGRTCRRGPKGAGMSDSAGTASRVADALREQIVSGELKPGTRLSEEHMRKLHGVSRSTLREAYQRLIRERLLVHELSRGVFVRQLSREDVADLYRVRRVVECAAVRSIRILTPAGLRRLSAAIADGRAAAEEARWDDVAAASIRFHEALVALAGSERLDAMMSGILAEFRLAYAHMSDTRVFHAAYLDRNREIAEALRSGDVEEAAVLLETYLTDSEAALCEGYPAR
ncbi:GntR-family transcriptional regulator [Streptomyces viridosporus ATCC 14672]|uniref:GntR family transcriptional regulator n=3 Tax=Streptomyces viridosporus TaxID=67581 RepID=A0ABX6A7Z5_STRVD|nr:GntR-family transcriptional regulator [Streptomyces viridosporus ATCC 14672]QEU83823.1 GntR family transcriptional regulator [Streptomyces viridosporus T7A]